MKIPKAIQYVQICRRNLSQAVFYQGLALTNMDIDFFSANQVRTPIIDDWKSIHINVDVSLYGLGVQNVRRCSVTAALNMAAYQCPPPSLILSDVTEELSNAT